MQLRRLLCGVSSFLVMRRPACDDCHTLENCWGLDMRKRLEELGGPCVEPARGIRNDSVRCVSADEVCHRRADPTGIPEAP